MRLITHLIMARYYVQKKINVIIFQSYVNIDKPGQNFTVQCIDINYILLYVSIIVFH